MITSTSNQQIKNIQLLMEKSKYRRETGLFVAEGIKMFLETPADMIHKVYVSADYMADGIHAEKIKKYDYEEVSPQIFKKMADTKAPQGILTIVKKKKYNSEEIINKGGIFLILNAIQDPGNLGTMIRTGEGAGISAVIMDKGCADPYNPKVIRSTMGSIYRVPLIQVDELTDIIPKMKASGIKMMAAHLAGDHYYDLEDYPKNTAIMIGNEGNGLADNISSLADVRVRIPMEGKVESLNAAVSAALLMYEVRRHLV